MMPPSGFSSSQTQHLLGFLGQCGKAIEVEAREKGLAPSEILALEIRKIAWFLENKSPTSLQKTSLQLLTQFYSDVLDLAPDNWDTFWEVWNQTQNEFNRQILAVEVLDSDILSQIHELAS